MEESITKFINSTPNGLYLIDMPTGTGKTTKAIDYIFNHIENSRKFFYITSLNKNIDDAYNKLKKKFEEANRLCDFEQKVLRIYSNYEMIVQNLNNIEYNPKDKIMQLDSFLELKKEIDMLNKLGNFDCAIKDKFIKNIREKLEPNFRRELRSYLKDKGKTKKERFRFILSNHKWLETIYPAILTDYRKVYFLSLDKFYLGNDTIIEPVYKFINSPLMENAIIFIDEIDAAKATLLNRIIQDSLKNKVNLVKLFLIIYYALESNKFPKEMLYPTTSKQTREGKYDTNIIESLKDHFKKVYNKFNMDYAFKLLEQDDDKKYIFDDSLILTITNKKDVKEMYVNLDRSESYNRIVYKNKTGNLQLGNVVRTLTNAIRRFAKNCYTLATNYLEQYNKYIKKQNGDVMQIDDAVLSVIRAFNIPDEYIDYLENLVLGKDKYYFSRQTTLANDIYDSGFKYYKFTDSTDNNFATSISLYDINATPESFLLTLASRTHIIGLSATSTMNTVTGNFDLTYLRHRLGNNFYKQSEEENNRINNEIANLLESNKAEIEVEFMSSVDIETSLKQLFSTEDYQNIIANKFDDDYNANRFLKIALAIKSFIKSGLTSLLILSNRNLAEDDSLFAKKTFEKVLTYIKKEANINDEYEIINLTSKNFIDNKKHYSDIVKNKVKVIIFSSYPTTGAGQNLQYEIEDNGNVTEEDINALYIEKPTNVLINTSLFSSATTEDLLKYIYQVEALMTNGEITLKDKNICIKEAFLRTNDSSSIRKHSNLYQTNSIKNHALSILIQAVGRICRTRNKTNKTLILVDSDIPATLDLFSIKDRRLNKEFMAIINKQAKEIDSAKNETEATLLLRKSENSNKVVNDNIHQILRKTWDKADTELWIKLRNYVLRRPVCSDLNDDNGSFSNCYLHSLEPISSYFYNQEDDYGKVTISLTKDTNLNSVVSEDECNLSLLMKNAEIKVFFEENGYATTFTKSNYIMLPVIFNNIYKGAIGEVVGNFILNKLNIKLEEISEPTEFEKFDFKHKNTFIDFKNWNDRGSSLDINHIKDKLKSIKGDKALVINLIGSKEDKIKKNSNIYVIPNLLYLENNNLTLNKEACDYITKLLEV